MSYTVLARRYRSATFDQVVGQNHVAQTLKKAIASGRVAHAYLFAGTRGVGKTSMARILAKALNCRSCEGPTSEPCLKCDSCEAIARGEDMDVIEIDAASNTGVDDVRQVIANAQYRPARSRFKVYIIDEAHMLSKNAFNALLKTLEEPPSHVKFILATTEPEKMPATVLSRCQRYDFRNISTREIADHLRQICKDESIKADEDALLLVAKAGAGSMRDAISLLERLLSIGEKHVSVETIESLLGLPRSQLIFDLAQAIGEGRVKDVLAAADRLINQGLSPDTLLAALEDHLRNLLVIRTCGAESNLVEVASISSSDMAKQAAQFDPVALTQDITVIEELRRQLRQTTAARALFDAAMVRLAMAGQFASIAELLARVDGGASPAPAKVAAPQKKKPESLSTAAVASPAPVTDTRQPVAAAASASDIGSADEDDDLPGPGKPWQGPSLAEAMKSASAADDPASSTSAASNVEPVDPADLPAVWKALLAHLADKPGIHTLLASGKLSGIEDGQLIIRYSPEHGTFVKMLARNGKKEIVSDAISSVVGKSMGVRFEVDEKAPAPTAETPISASPDVAPAAPPIQKAVEPDRPQQPVVPNNGRPTPEQLAGAQRNPLVSALMAELGATIVRISED